MLGHRSGPTVCSMGGAVGGYSDILGSINPGKCNPGLARFLVPCAESCVRHGPGVTLYIITERG